MATGVTRTLIPPDTALAPVASTSSAVTWDFFKQRLVVIYVATAPISVTPTTGSLILTGYAPTVATPRVVTPATGTLTLTGYPPTVSTPRVVTPTTGMLTLTGYAPTVSTPRLVTPTTGTLVLTGYAPTISTPQTFTPTTGELVLTGYAPTVTVGTPSSIIVTPDTGTLVLTGYAPDALVQTPRRTYGVPSPGKPRRRADVRESSGTGSIPSFGFARAVRDAALRGRLLQAVEVIAVGSSSASIFAFAPVRVGAEAQPLGECGISGRLDVPAMIYAICATESHCSGVGAIRMLATAHVARDRRMKAGLPIRTGYEAAPILEENEEAVVLAAMEIIRRRLTGAAP